MAINVSGTTFRLSKFFHHINKFLPHFLEINSCCQVSKQCWYVYIGKLSDFFRSSKITPSNACATLSTYHLNRILHWLFRNTTYASTLFPLFSVPFFFATVSIPSEVLKSLINRLIVRLKFSRIGGESRLLHGVAG